MVIKTVKRKPMQGCAKKINYIEELELEKKTTPIESILRLKVRV